MTHFRSASTDETLGPSNRTVLEAEHPVVALAVRGFLLLAMPLVSLAMAMTLVNYATTVSAQWLAGYFLYGVHTLTLLCLWTMFGSLGVLSRLGLILLGLLYLVIAAVCWLVPALGVISWT